MATRDVTQIGQPIPPAPPLPSSPLTVPSKLVKIDPAFQDYYNDAELRYKKIIQAIRSFNDDVALPVSTLKANQQNYLAEFQQNRARLDIQIKNLADADSAQISRITVLEATVSGSAGINTYIQPTAPTSPLTVGSLWFDSSTTKFLLSRWNGSAWIPVENSDIAAAIARITTIETSYVTLTTANTLISASQAAAVASANGYTAAQITSLSSIYATQTSVTTQIATAQTAAVSTANGYTNGQISGLSSIYATPSGVTAAISSAISASLSSTAGGTIGGAISSLSSVYATPSSVTAAISSAISASLSSTAGGTIGGAISALSSVYVTPSGVTASINSNISAQIAATTTSGTIGYSLQALSDRIDAVTASAGIHSYVQSTAPSGANLGDIWFDTSDNTKPYRWSGSAWVDTADTRVAAVVTQATALATADGFLQGKYSLKVIAGNIVTGMNITSSTGTGTDISSIKFNASDFLIYNGSGTTGVPVFSASSGVVKLANTLVVDQASTKLYVGVGTFGNANTAFYVDSAGSFSLKDKLTWDGSTLSITGSITVTGGNALTTGGAAADVNSGSTLITGTKISTGSLSAISANLGTVTTGTLTSGTVFSGTLDAGSGYARTYIDGTSITFGYASGFTTTIYHDSVTAGASRITMATDAGGGTIDFYATSSINGGVSQLIMTDGNGAYIDIETGTGFSLHPVSTAGAAFNLRIVGESNSRFEIFGDASLRWGSGSAVQDVTLDRRTAGELETNSQFWCTQLRNPAVDGWTVPLYDGALAISFKWTGSQVKVRIGSTDIGAINII